jgi:hypothetical protein
MLATKRIEVFSSRDLDVFRTGELPMPYTLEALATDIKATLKKDPSRTGKEAVCKLVSKALLDQDFIAKHLTSEQCKPRKVLYEDPELGFCICGHVYEGPANGAPHDHGSSWAIYGQAVGTTEMTDWRIIEKGGDGKPSLVEPERVYSLAPGDCYFYDVGAVHSPKRMASTKLIRIEGANLDHVKRSHIKAAATA